jgi:starch synthase
MKILFVAAEMAPLTKVGGLADVVRSLPVELIKRGHEVRVIVPKYGFVDYSQYQTEPVISNLTVLSLQEYRKISVEQINIEEVPVYLLSADVFAGARDVYGDYEIEKFWVFNDCVCEVLPYLGWQPSIVNCHDWHSALIPLLTRNKHGGYRTVFTIHNIRYQGNINEQLISRSGLGQYWQAGILGRPPMPWNFMTQGILWSHVINTVSVNFAREIMTAEYGCGMQSILEFRKESLSGIRNGLGQEEYDPLRDKLIAANYDAADIEGKLLNKKEVQRMAGWKSAADIPLAGMVARLDEQKGMDIILDAIPEILSRAKVQFVFLGRGKEYYEEALQQLESRYPDSVKAFITFDNDKAHLLYAGSDLFLMPSQWEPCGLGQMIAMKYGTVPVVRKTGGLADTVHNLSQDLKHGTGFVFNDYSSQALVFTLKKAVAAFSERPAWERVIRRVMAEDLSWREPAEKYEALYQRALELNISEPL